MRCSDARAREGGEIDRRVPAFRAGILRHIAWRRRSSLRAAKEARGGEPLPLAQRHEDRSWRDRAAARPDADSQLVLEIRSILEPHNLVEGGAGRTVRHLRDAARRSGRRDPGEGAGVSQVKLAPHYDGPEVFRRAKDALETSARQFRPRSTPS